MSVEPAQIKAARALLGWTQTQLSQASGMALATIVSIEKGKGSEGSMFQVVGFLSTRGVSFADDRPGNDLVVRLKRKTAPRKPVPPASAPIGGDAHDRTEKEPAR